MHKFGHILHQSCFDTIWYAANNRPWLLPGRTRPQAQCPLGILQNCQLILDIARV